MISYQLNDFEVSTSWDFCAAKLTSFALETPDTVFIQPRRSKNTDELSHFSSGAFDMELVWTQSISFVTIPIP